MSHSVSGQSWQVGDTDGEGGTVNFETGQGIPAWSLKIEGRLLEVCLNHVGMPSGVLTVAATKSTLSRQSGTPQVFDLYQEDDSGTRS